MTVFTNPNGTIRKTSRNLTFILDQKACCIRTYTRSKLSNEPSLTKTENFGSLATAQLRFNLKK